jgi:hypothetical protein
MEFDGQQKELDRQHQASLEDKRLRSQQEIEGFKAAAAKQVERQKAQSKPKSLRFHYGEDGDIIGAEAH